MAARNERPTRYIIMPREGFTDPVLLTATFQPSNRAVAVQARAEAVMRPQMRVLDTIRENGPKLVEMPPEGELSLRLSMPGLKIVPEVFYDRQWYRPEIEDRPVHRLSVTRAAAKPAQAQIQVIDRASGSALRGARVIAFTDFANRVGAEGTTGANGEVRLAGIVDRYRDTKCPGSRPFPTAQRPPIFQMQAGRVRPRLRRVRIASDLTRLPRSARGRSMDTRAVVHIVGADPESVDSVTARLRSRGIEIVDEQPNMLLVTGDKDAVARALGQAKGWSVSEERTIPPPRTRPQVLRKP